MKKMMWCLAMLLAVSACTTVSVSYSSIAPPGAREVFAEDSHFNVLGLRPMPRSELTALRDRLNDQCENGGVTGIVARTYTIFAIIGVVEKTEVSGYCGP